ncbi:fibronectin type III domain-containing protein [Pseudobutyrivibrio xylanivorans]|uniref:Fibronectin type-III domain-containing protein n=1 Tax=Pseudobutyrivibrio xylanivorans TaxID=185007 RepID=A0A1G5RPQ2_PSEXY|nr:fibronectin type III domain-containing protein [Pseudobutyrivibrio xylanivorans]SCZ75987.1 hypothetical protein SAMN02910350_00020 [Pseudobutyrivibrio xylanivorans]
MRENLNAIKRLVAFTLTVLLLGTTIWNDVFVIATEENHCSEYVDEQTYAARLLQPVGEGDGYCDYCGQVEQSHIHEMETEVEEEIVEDPQPVEELPVEETAEDISVPEEPQPEIENTEYTVSENVEEITPEDTPVVENIDGEETPEDIEESEEEKNDNEEEKAECEHEWTYTSNGDGTHVKKCSKCDEEITEDCTFDEEGKCVHCGYEQKEECEHEWEYISNENGTHIKRCKICGEEVEETCQLDENGICHDCLYEDERLMYQEFSKTLFGTTVKVSGDLPRGARVDIFYAGTRPVEEIINENTDETNFTAFVAFDIDIYRRGGEKYQPQEDGGSVQVSFMGVEEVEQLSQEDVSVYRIEDDNQTVTEIECEVYGEEVRFDADHFTTYAAGTPSITSKEKIEDWNDFAYINSTGDNAYTTLTQVKFYLYFQKQGTVNLTIKSFKNLKSTSVSGDTALYEDPENGVTLYPNQTLAVTGDAGTYKEVTVDFTGSTSTYMTRNTYYSVVVEHDKACYVVYGANGPNCYIGNDQDGWVGNLNGIFQGEVVDTNPPAAADDVTISKINSKSENRDFLANGTTYTYYYAKNDTDILTAVFSEASAERTVTWKSDDSNVVKVVSESATTASIAAVGKGTATITAEYNGDSKTINISVIEFEVMGKPIDGLQLDYFGAKLQKSDIKGYITSTAISDNYLSAEIKGDGSVTTEGEMTLTFTSPDDAAYSKLWKKNYQINPLELVESVFYTDTNNDDKNDKNIVMSIVGGQIQQMTGMGTIRANDSVDVLPVYDANKKDFTATIVRSKPGPYGLQYTVAIVGEGNFTGSFQVNLTSSGSKTDISTVLTARLSSNSDLKSATYNGNAYGLTDRTDVNSKVVGWNEVEFVGNNEAVIDSVVTKQTATYTITDVKTGKTSTVDPNAAITAGEKLITFTMNADSGYTGSLTVSFTVAPKPLASSEIAIEWLGVNDGETKKKPHKENDQPVTLEPGTDFIVTFGGTTVDPSQYDISYDNNTAITANARVILTGKENYTGNRSATFEIIAAYDVDLQIILSDGKDYTGTKANSYNFKTAGYTKIYDPTLTASYVISMIKVYLPGNRQNNIVTSNYTITVTNDDGTTFSPSVGKKKIQLVPDSTIQNEFGLTGTDDGTRTATFEIEKRDISTGGAILFDYSAPTDKVYTGNEITISTAEAGDSTGKNLKVYFEVANNTILEEGQDYTIDYGGTNINAGTARFTITGTGNYKGTKELSSFKFTIAKKSLKDADVIISYAFPSGMDNVYDGTEKKPTVTVKIGSQTVAEFADTAQTKRNYSVSYQNNINVSTTTKKAEITVTAGTNGNDGVNLKDSKVTNFMINASSAKFADFQITGDNGMVHATPYSVDGTPEIWECRDLDITYTGSEIERWVDVYINDKNNNPVKLKKDVDFRVSYENNEDAKTYNTSDVDASPQIIITGRGNYSNIKAKILFTIKPILIKENDPLLDLEAPGAYTKAYDYIDSTTPINFVFNYVKYNGNTLTNNDYTLTLPDDITSAGEKKAEIKFNGNYAYKDSSNPAYELPFTIGIDVSNTTVVSFANPYDSSDTNYYSTKGTGYKVRWANSHAPIINFQWQRLDNAVRTETFDGGTSTNPTAVPLLTSNGISIKDEASNTSIKKYDSRAAGATGNQFNTITVTLTAAKDASGVYTGEFYGEKVITYEIAPVSLNEAKNLVNYTDTNANIKYTGAEIAPPVTAKYKYGVSSDSNATTLYYTLDKTTDFTLSPDTIGPNVGSYPRTLTGCGNFDESQSYTFRVTQGDVKVYLKPTTGDNEGQELELSLSQVADTNPLQQEVTIADTQEVYVYKKGKEYKPKFILKDSSGTNTLVEGKDYNTISYNNYNKPTTAGAPSTAIISIPANGNYITTVITVKYIIKTNAIDDGTGVLSIGGTGSVPYTAKTYNAADIKTAVDRDPSILTVKLGSQTLEYGTDYKILVPTDTSAVSDFNEWKEKKNDNSQVIGTNTLPSYADVGEVSLNYFWVEGINDYSGFIKVPFNIILNLADDSMTAITIKDASYELNNDGSCTNADGTSKITPEVTFRAIDGATGTYGETLTANEIKKYLNITRAKEGYPGPDGGITVSGIKGCKGTVSNLKYYDTTTSTKVPVKFLARLGSYTKISMSTGEVYPYTGSAVEVSFVGIDEDAVKVDDVRLIGDYVLTYEDTASPANIYATTVNVGTYRARITATEKSSYFVPGTSQAYEYKIKYNLGNAVIKFYDPGNNTVEIEQTPYTSGGYDLASNAKLFVNNKEIYPTGGNGDTTGWVTFNPTKLTKVGQNQPVTVTSNNDLVYGTCTGSMSVGGISIDSATVKIVGKTAPYEYDYTGDYITPTVSVELGTETLELTRDYTVSYKDNKNAGTATIIVKGTSAYSGTAEVTFTINKVAITADMIEVGDAFYAGYGIEVKPTVVVKNKSGMTLSPNIEYEVRYERNSSGARDKSSTTPLPPAVYVTAKANSNYTGTNVEKAFTIEKLDLSSTDVNVDIETTEYTGQELKEYDIIKVFVGTKELDPTGKTSGAEDYRIDIYNASGQPAKLLDKGQYTIDIVGLEVNTTGTKELHIEITDRSLPNNWHYYFDGNDFSSSTSTWSYVPSKKAFVSQPVAGSKDNLIITVYDVEEFTEGTEVTPRITIEDKGIQISTTTTNEDGTTTTVSKNKVLTKDDFEITKVINGDKAGTGEWSRILKTDGTHALPTADSPAVEITGIGNYTGSITLPFNIGKNLNTLIEENSLHVEFTVTNSYYTSSGSQTNKYDYGATSISYIYNSNTQIPEPKLDYTYTPTGATSSRTITLTKGTEYTVSVEDAKGEEDSSVNAGEKYIVIKGKGKYCGTIKQKYVITKKLVDETTETGFDKDATKTMQTVDGGYTFVVLGNTVSRLNEDTAKKYLYDEANPTKYRDYIGYYYAVFNKEPIEPKVQVKDNKLGPLKNKSVVISEDDLVIDYKKADESFDPGQNNFSEIQISFKANAAESSAGLNYYATSTGSATFVIHYIVVQGDLSSGFTVDFVNGTAGANTDFDGTEKTPDIVVTNGSKELVENQDYTKEYKNNILPGVAEVVVTGMGNYKGQTSNTFTISGNLGTDTVEAYQDINGNYVEGKLTQDYIGGAFEPNILLMIPETTAMIAAGIPEVDRVLTYSGNGGNAQTDDYTLVGEPTSTNGFVSSGTVVYAGNGARYWKGTKEINFNIAFDEANLDLTNKNQSYPYTGEEIKPVFKLPLSEKVYEIKNIQYLRNGTDATDFVNAGSIDVIVTAKVGEQDREFYDTYTITKRNLNDDDVRVIYTKNYRYTGSQIKPPVVVFIQNESSVHTLVEGTDYKIEYGKNTDGYLENKEEGSITLRGMGTNIESVRMEHFNIDVGFPVNVQIPKDKITSSSITVTWTPDVYSTGDIVKLYKVDSDKNETYVGEKNVTDHSGECTFTGLDSVADYKAYVHSYVKTSNDEFQSEVRSAEAITGIQTSSVNVVSNAPGTVTISDWPKDGAVIIYKIYRADTADTSVPGTLVACYPASVNSFTNTGLPRGKYYYYVEGYCVLNSKLTCANTSERVPVDVE